MYDIFSINCRLKIKKIIVVNVINIRMKKLKFNYSRTARMLGKKILKIVKTFWYNECFTLNNEPCIEKIHDLDHNIIYLGL